MNSRKIHPNRQVAEGYRKITYPTNLNERLTLRGGRTDVVESL